MKRVLFVSNGHGEQAIVARIVAELGCPNAAEFEHLCLVGTQTATDALRAVGPRRALPSGGLIAMGNARNLLRDVRAGLIGHTLAQLRFLRNAAGRYDVAVAVGDTFALGMAQRARAAKTVFVGTAKSVFVAPYGKFERAMLRRADVIFVRDAPTARYLQDRGVAARAPGNVIVDLFAPAPASDALAGKTLAIFPGSRQGAYADAVFACAIVRELAATQPAIETSLSIAPGLDAERFAQVLQQHGWDVTPMGADHVPFVLTLNGRPVVTAWDGSPAAMLASAIVVLGQAGTANEAAAAHGIPVVAFERGGGSAAGWYRRRQRGLLDGALAILKGCASAAARDLASLLADEPRRARMGAIGRERMGAPGGAQAIAAELRGLLQC